MTRCARCHAGEIGRLAVRGPTGCRYLDDPRQADYVKDGWNITGDSFTMDADGYLHFAARNDDMIVSSGYNIAGPEVEAALLSHDAVAECAVIGAPDEARGQIVEAHVVLAEGLPPVTALVEALQATSRRRSRPTSTQGAWSSPMRCRKPQPARSSAFCSSNDKTATNREERKMDATVGVTPAERRARWRCWDVVGQTYTPKLHSDNVMIWHAHDPAEPSCRRMSTPRRTNGSTCSTARWRLISVSNGDVSANKAGPGDLIRMPRGIAHGVYNRSGAEATCVFGVAPARKLSTCSAHSTMSPTRPNWCACRRCTRSISCRPRTRREDRHHGSTQICCDHRRRGSGLAAAKAFDERGHRVTGFERSHDFGGVWEPSRSYPDVQTQSPKDLYRYTDLPMPAEYPEWPKGPQVHAYLHAMPTSTGWGGSSGSTPVSRRWTGAPTENPAGP